MGGNASQVQGGIKKVKLQKLPLRGWGVTGSIPVDIFDKLMGLSLLSPFHQSGSPDSDWCFVEFWSRDEALILDLVLEIVPDIELV